MKRTTGRNIFITDLAKVLREVDPAQFAQRCRAAGMSGVWIRVGRGANRDANLRYSKLSELRTELDAVGAELWGWHVPFCAGLDDAIAEATKVLRWAEDAALAGIVVDAERTPESPRFRGAEREAVAYLEPLRRGLEAAGRGVAFSSHDQPSLHRDMPFRPFLDYIEDVCPQVYYTSANPQTRLRKSIDDYKALIPNAEFASRYKPTGNITMTEDVAFPDVATCLTATSKFLALVNSNGFPSCSFWCADNAPEHVWRLFAETMVSDGSTMASAAGETMNLDAAQLRLNIVQDYVPAGNSNRPGTRMSPSSITIHNTDNDSPGANAAAHARYMKGPDAQMRQVSWHFTVDDKYVYQSIPTNETAWHTATRQGNETSIGIEICMNSDLGDVDACYDRAALLTAWLAYRMGIQVPSNVYQHHDWSGKNCPRVLRSKPNGWADFLAKVQRNFRNLTPVNAPLIARPSDDHHHDEETPA
ncbi:N-acetylmuramoyl-L-alanine amidase [Bradyrhizobium japonicum]|uniref:N-acetylmuramoyl-L-alanine amidase n=1 Tax=Bradyrhizobium japonicum TaxID=375 RepID=UPI001BA64892|nr:N-acetylmuramoyl-L-alanine amidase [Bradyrhizobium japonicum]MBR0911465.1 N-acetylmuramoyl-L-alanine amidase [Bradyrhizobium japonicum]